MLNVTGRPDSDRAATTTRPMRFSSEPRNFQLWSPVLETAIRAARQHGRDWLVDLPTRHRGPALLAARNDYGVLDYTVIPEDGGAEPRRRRCGWSATRRAASWSRQFFQQPGMTDEAFASYVEWARNDFMV